MLLRRLTTVVSTAGLLALPAAAARATTPDQDAEFLKAAHQVNLAEIAAGRIAFTTSKDPVVKKVAAALMRDHIRLDADLYLTARQLRVFLPNSPTPEQQALAKRYLAAGANTFDEYFISTQLAGHREALKMATEHAANGVVSSVKRFAQEARPVIAQHRLMLREAAAKQGMSGYTGTGGRNG